MSLRSRLLLGLVIVTTVGLGIAGFAVYGQIRSYLVNQLDAQIVSQARGNACVGGGPRDLPQGTFIYEMSSSLQELCPPTSLTYVQPATSTYPDLPTAALHEVVSSGNGALLTVSSPAGIDYRVYAWVPQSVFGPSALQVIAVPLTAVDDTLHRLVLIDLAVSAAVLLLLIVLGYAVVRVGLRPLEAIEETAGKIAAGDLSRRVARDEPETEVGRLGASLNAMLSQIENAFGEQQASEQRLRQFIADASHELRTPLTSIRGYAELFRRGAAARPEDLGRSMRRIEDEAARMGVLVEDMLLLARLDQGRPLERRPVDLAAIAADAAADAQAVDPGRPVSYEAAGAVVVEGDEARLRQVAGNLVQNAVVHTPPGTPVWVRVGREGATAVLEVADAGPGLSPEHAAHIFERFYRADSSRARQSGGTGLGLAIVASLAAAHGGRASVTTAPGSGARFRVELPLLAQPLPPPAAAPTFGGPTGFGESWDGGPEASSSEPSPPDHRAAP
ncbi:MAG TPA: HAMP domain-containing sensor histidine kinase [Acidimicrobiales bacterium]|nr:HAMP domain-containing sensor histidine kinase [Acidimicrobiales bacterium]